MLDGRRIWWPAGRMVGGSSAINAMIYSRGHPRSYDRWRIGGDVDWSFESLLPYFRRAEDQERGPSPYHGVGGPIGVSSSRYRHALAESFVDGCAELGIAPTDDFNGSRSDGAGFFQLFQRDGRRSTTAAYLDREDVRARLTLHLRARVSRVLFEGRRAVGVELVAGDRTYAIRAEREVILSAGVVRSPHLLMLSGVGSAEALRSAGVRVVADRGSVGANLQDHVRVPVIHALGRPRPTRVASLLREGLAYVGARRGLFTSNVCDAAAIVLGEGGSAVPQLRIACRWRAMPEDPRTLVDFEVVLIDPSSRGRLTLTRGAPSHAPTVDPGYLRERADRAALERGVELARAIAASAACRAAGVGEERLPGATDVAAHLRQRADSAYHGVGTCRLGSDDAAVVDPALRVIGVDALRVVDASVMPTTVAGNAQAAVVAIAERAADLILGRSGAVAG
jgi:choline dehydrogenase